MPGLGSDELLEAQGRTAELGGDAHGDVAQQRGDPRVAEILSFPARLFGRRVIEGTPHPHDEGIGNSCTSRQVSPSIVNDTLVAYGVCGYRPSAASGDSSTRVVGTEMSTG